MTAEERDPAVVRQELRWRRAAATFLFHRLNRNAAGETAAMQLAMIESHAYQVPVSTVLLTVIDLINTLVTGADRERLTDALQAEMTMYYGISGP